VRDVDSAVIVRELLDSVAVEASSVEPDASKRSSHGVRPL
jgi:hypothetical protein